MGGKIEGYVDVASPYSYFGLKYLKDRRDLLKQYDIEVEMASGHMTTSALEWIFTYICYHFRSGFSLSYKSMFHPFFLGGVNVATGNSPPSLPAKKEYNPYELKRACTFFDTPSISAPPFFPMFSLLPQRSMIAIKSRHPRDKFESVYETCWLWVFQHHRDLSKTEAMREFLQEQFDESEAEEILRLAATKEVKELLNARTKESLGRGAFGAPWFWMTNAKGESEPLFGSDRWSYMFRFMGVDVSELTIVDKSKAKL